MSKKNKLLFQTVILSLVVAALSFLSVNFWKEKREIVTNSEHMVFEAQMTLREISQKNHIPEKVILTSLNQPQKNLNKTFSEVSFNLEQGKEKILKNFALYEENSTKNWFKIPLKFLIWFIIMGAVFFMMKKGTFSFKRRKYFYALGFIVFGIVLGSDPSPMGTVKDAIALFGKKGVIFKPRMVALGIFLLTVFLANKMICSWGCQFGALQDFIFRLNRTKKDNRGLIKQYQVPFRFSNTIRVIFFIIFTALAFIIPFDIISEVDPFKIFKPQYMTILGIVFVSSLLILSLFIYRPWCTFFCPFGLTGWIVEKFSWFKIRVDYNKCDSCSACEKACPTDTMEAILKREKVIGDCFSCSSCIDACPDQAISFTSLKREKPPKGHFDKTSSC